MPTLVQGTLLTGNTIVFPLASQLANAVLIQCCRRRSHVCELLNYEKKPLQCGGSHVTG